MYRNTEQDNIPLNEERPWSAKEKIGISDEGAKRKKFSSETHYWWAKHLNSGLRFLLTLVLILTLTFFTCATFIAFCRKCDEETKNTALCPTLLHLDASSPLGIIGTKLVASNSSQQSLVPGSGGFSGPQSEGGNSRGSTEWGRGQ